MFKFVVRQLLNSILLTLLMTSLGAAKPLDQGEIFPDIPLPAPELPSQRAYLGLTDQKPFTLKQITGRVVLVEILNVFCPHCRKQTKPYNELYRMIEADPATRGQIKLLGVAVANDDEAIEDFVDIYGVAFPVVSDRNFKLHRALRAGPTPFSLYTLRDQPGDAAVITDNHLGVDQDMPALFAYLKELLSMKTIEFTALPQEQQLATEELRPPQSTAEIAQLIEQSFRSQGNNLTGFRKLQLPSKRQVYTGLLDRNGQRQPLFAEVASRSAICDICHSVHFFYLFDHTGLILDFVPLHLTKYGNIEWNKAESDLFARRVVGKQLAGSWKFNSRVDAVTSATMTSAIIFDNFDQGGELLEELQRENVLEP